MGASASAASTRGVCWLLTKPDTRANLVSACGLCWLLQVQATELIELIELVHSQQSASTGSGSKAHPARPTLSKASCRVSSSSVTREPVTALVFIHCARRYTRSRQYRMNPGHVRLSVGVRAAPHHSWARPATGWKPVTLMQVPAWVLGQGLLKREGLGSSRRERQHSTLQHCSPL